MQSAAEMRDVFGDSDEDEQEGYETHMDLDLTSHVSQRYVVDMPPGIYNVLLNKNLFKKANWLC